MKTKELEKKTDALKRMTDRGSLCRSDANFISKLLASASDGRKTSKRIYLIHKLEDLHIIASSANY